MALLTFLLTTLLLLTTTSALSLNQFQPIVSFPSACTAAYNTPISGCDTRDFSGGNPCSKDCITSLEEISAKINAACVGTRADPTTLIGLFFAGTGVSTLCPNVVAVSAGAGSSNTGNGIIGESTLTAPSATSVDSSVIAASSTASSSETTTTSASSSKKESKTVASTTSETAAQTSTTSTTASSKADTTSKSITTTSTGLRGGFTTTAVNNGVASVITDKAQQSANPDGFGGGGSPFEVGVNGASTLSASALSSSLLLSFVAGMALLLLR